MDEKEQLQRKGNTLNPNTYEMERFQKNAMIILSIDRGSNDERVLIKTFGALNFEITLYRYSEILQALSTLEKYCTRDFGDCGCVCLAILAHDTSVSIHEIQRCFDIKRNPALAGKPIVIIIQECSRNKLAYEKDNFFELDDPVDPGYGYVSTQPDMIVFQLFSRGILSYRDQQGSDTIKILCEEITLRSSKDDLNTIFSRAMEVLSRKSVDSHMFSTLTKKLYLSDMGSEQQGENNEKGKTEDKEISLDSTVYHHATNLSSPKDVEPPSTQDPPSESNEQAPSNSQSTADDSATMNNTSTNTENTNTSNLSSIDQSNINHPKHILKKYAPTYELEEYSRNVMIIFNHEKFLCDDPRIGTIKDEEALTETFTKYGFAVQPYMDLKRRVLLETVKKFAEQTDFSTYGCICVAVLTHGGNGPGYLQAHDTSYSEHEIIERFNARKNSTLAGKPIIFLIQACRGRDPAPAVQAGTCSPSDLEYDRAEDCEHYTIPTESDMLIFHSSYKGRASVRSRKNGTWFIQTLCSMIKKHAATCDLETIFRKVKMAVALDAAEWVEDAQKVPKQMPVVTSTVIREIHLRPYDPQPLDAESKDEVDKAIDSGLESMQISDASSLNEDPPSTDMSATSSMHYMPCSCFLEYFEYLKKCLGLYVCENSEDLVAKTFMEIIEQEGDGVEHIYVKLRLMETVWDHLKKHPDKFPYDYVYRSYY